MSSTYFETEDSSSGFDCLYWCMDKLSYQNCIYNSLPEDGLSVLQHEKNLKIKN
jgi:hypothetical protein